MVKTITVQLRMQLTKKKEQLKQALIEVYSMKSWYFGSRLAPKRYNQNHKPVPLTQNGFKQKPDSIFKHEEYPYQSP